MKYLVPIFMLAFLAMPVMAAEKAAPEDPAAMGGFEGPVSGAKAESVEKALKLPQDAPVVLTGHIVSRQAAEKNTYIFKDKTGEIPVVITPKGFKGHKINPETKVCLVGKVEKQASDPNAPRVKVSRLDVVSE